LGKAKVEADPSEGHFDEMPPPAPAQILPLAFVTSQVARKSYALWPLAVKS
jgi:hypothetical protein